MRSSTPTRSIILLSAIALWALPACGDDNKSAVQTPQVDPEDAGEDTTPDVPEEEDVPARPDVEPADVPEPEDVPAPQDTGEPDVEPLEDVEEDVPESPDVSEDVEEQDVAPEDVVEDVVEDVLEDVAEDVGEPDVVEEVGPPAPALALIPLGIEQDLLGVWAQSPDRVFIAGDAPVQIIDRVASYWPPDEEGSRRSRAVAGGAERGSVYVANKRPTVFGRFANGDWRTVSFVGETLFDDLNMIENGSREMVAAASLIDGLLWNGRANERNAGWNVFLGSRCPGEPLGTRFEPCPVDSVFLVGGEFDRDVWLSAEDRIINMRLGIQSPLIYEEIAGTAHDIYVAPDGAVFTAGPEGELHWKIDGRWSELFHPSGRDLHGVWAASGDEAWAVGDGGLVLYFDGADWTVEETGVETALRGVFGASDQRWIVGDGGVLLWAAPEEAVAPAGTVVVPAPPDRDGVVRILSVTEGTVLITCRPGNVLFGNNLDHVGNSGDIFVDGYNTFPDGEETFWVEIFGPNDCFGLDDGAVTVDVGQNTAHTLVVEEAIAPFRDYVTFEDDLTPPTEFDGARIRVLNFAQELPAYGNVDVCFQNEPLGPGLSARQASDYFELPADTIFLQIKAAAEPACSGELLKLTRMAFDAGAAHTVTLMQGSHLGNDHLAVLTCVDGIDGLPESPSTCVRDDYIDP